MAINKVKPIIHLMPTSTKEDYLKALYQLGGEKERVALGQIAHHLSLTPGTVTTMMKQLQANDFVEYESRKGAQLTKLGRDTAVNVLRRHRLIESFLVDIMKIDWAHVHEEAEILEHALSDRLIARIDEMLDYPTVDPHGDPIPSARGKIKKNSFTPLSDCEPGHYILRRISRDDSSFLQWLDEAQLKPGTIIEVLGNDRIAETVFISIVPKKSSHLTTAISNHLLVEHYNC